MGKKHTTEYSEAEIRQAVQIAIDFRVPIASEQTGMPTKTIHNYIKKLRKGEPIRGIGSRTGMLTYIRLKDGIVELETVPRHKMEDNYSIGPTPLPREKLERKYELLERKYESLEKRLTDVVETLHIMSETQRLMRKNVA